MLKVLLLMIVAVATCDSSSRCNSNNISGGNHTVLSMRNYAVKYPKEYKKDRKALYGSLMSQLKSTMGAVSKINDNKTDTPDMRENMENGNEMPERVSATDPNNRGDRVAEEKNYAKREVREAAPLWRHLDEEVDDMEKTMGAILREETPLRHRLENEMNDLEEVLKVILREDEDD